MLCNSKTDASGKLEQSFSARKVATSPFVSAPKTGRLYAFAHREFWWSAGDDGNWFGGDSSDRIELIADRKQYEPGQTASIQVRMPFQNATVLVSVERGRDRSVQPRAECQQSGGQVPIKPSYGPNVFVSVLAVRGACRA